MRKILLVDDEPHILNSLERLVQEVDDLEPYTAHSAEEALDFLQGQWVDIIMSDEMMPGLHGSEFLSLCAQTHPDSIRILLTAHSSMEAAIHAINEAKVSHYLRKPWMESEIITVLERSVETLDLKQKNQDLNIRLLAKQKELEQKNTQLNTMVEERTVQLRRSLVSLKEKHHHINLMNFQVIEFLTHLLLRDRKNLINRINMGLKLYRFFIAMNEESFSPELVNALRLNAVFESGTLGSREVLVHLDAMEPLVQLIELSKENYDGSGPKGLEAHHIPDQGRLFKVLWEISRPRKPGEVDVIATLKRGNQRHFDPNLVQSFVSLIEQHENIN